MMTLRIVVSWLFTAAVCLAGPDPFPFAEITIDEAQSRLERGEITSLGLTRAYLERIAQIDQAGPALRSVIEVNPDALAMAAQCDTERAAGKVRGPLHGIPVLLKDNLATADRMETTAGSLALVGARPREDAALVARLREAGAVILGKTNLSEWANLRGERSVSGWSARGGQTRNPYALDRSPSGSSSGSAVAVSANLCVVAVGTETDGSIVSPAATVGIVGMRPTVGLVSRRGMIPISATQDTAGPMARTVRDAAALLTVLAGSDPADVATSHQPDGLNTNFVAGLGSPVLNGARVGVLRGPFRLSRKTEPILDAAVAMLQSAGAEIIELGFLPTLPQLSAAEFDVLLYEFKAGLNAYFQSLGESSRIKTIGDLIAFNEAHAAEELAFFGQEYLQLAEAMGPLSDPAYLEALADCDRLARAEGIDAVIAMHQLDTIVTVTTGPAGLIDPVNGDSSTGGSSTLAAVAGYPSVTVPAGQICGLPIGISFTGPAWSDARQLALAADFEGRTRARREPALER
jgi:amidase